MKRENCISFMFLLLAFVTTGCEESDRGEPVGGGKIDLLHVSEKIQTAFADDASAGSFTFASPADWAVFVMEGSVPASVPVLDESVSWIRLLLDGEESRMGEAGTYTLTVSLEPNRSGAERSATVILICGRDRVAITVTQSEINRPEPEPTQLYERYVEKIVYEVRNMNAYEYSFQYDDMHRLKSIDYRNNLGLEADKSYRFDYVDDTTVKMVEQSGSTTATSLITLNEDGSVAAMHYENDTTRGKTYHYEKGYLVSVVDHAGNTETLTWREDGNLLTDNPKSMLGFNYYYTVYANNPKMNFDLNGLFTREFDLFTLLNMTGLRSQTYVSSRNPWGDLAYEAYQGYYDSSGRKYYPLEYYYDAYGYVKRISLTWNEKAGGTVTPTDPSGSLLEITNSVSWYITYTK